MYSITTVNLVDSVISKFAFQYVLLNHSRKWLYNFVETIMKKYMATVTRSANDNVKVVYNTITVYPRYQGMDKTFKPITIHENDIGMLPAPEEIVSYNREEFPTALAKIVENLNTKRTQEEIDAAIMYGLKKEALDKQFQEYEKMYNLFVKEKEALKKDKTKVAKVANLNSSINTIKILKNEVLLAVTKLDNEQTANKKCKSQNCFVFITSGTVEIVKDLLKGWNAQPSTFEQLRTIRKISGEKVCNIIVFILNVLKDLPIVKWFNK